MTGHKVVVCKCGCLKTMESSGSWLLPTMNHSLCSDPIVSLQSLSSELGLITGWVITGLGCKNLPVVTVVTALYLRSVTATLKALYIPKTSTLHLTVVVLPVHLQEWFLLVTIQASYLQSTTLNRQLTKEAFLIGVCPMAPLQTQLPIRLSVVTYEKAIETSVHFEIKY